MRHRDFALFFSAALLSNTGTWMQTITVPYVLDQLTHSTVWVGVGAFSTFFATALSFLLVIGALLMIAPRPVAVISAAGSVLSHFHDGMRYVRQRAVLMVAVLGALFSSLLGVSMIQLAEPFARQVLH